MIKMSVKFWLVTLILSLGFFTSAGKILAQPVSSDDLISHARDYDGKIVSYEGEIIGDIMKRGAFSWVNINDGKNALGVWAKNDLLKGLVYTGSYRCQGDLVEATGIFHRSCLEHGGDLDIHASSLRKVSSGRNKSEKINTEKLKMVFMLLGVSCLVLILSQLNLPLARPRFFFDRFL